MLPRRTILVLIVLASIGCAGHRPLATPVVDRAYGTDVTMLPAAIRFRSEPGEMTIKLRAPVYLTAIELTSRLDAYRVVYSSSDVSSFPLTGYADIGITTSAQVVRGRKAETRGHSATTGSAPDCRSMQQPTDRSEAFFNSDCGTYNLFWSFERSVLLVATSTPWRPGPDARNTDWLVTLSAPPGVTGEWAVMPIAPTSRPTFILRTTP